MEPASSRAVHARRAHAAERAHQSRPQERLKSCAACYKYNFFSPPKHTYAKARALRSGTPPCSSLCRSSHCRGARLTAPVARASGAHTRRAGAQTRAIHAGWESSSWTARQTPAYASSRSTCRGWETGQTRRVSAGASPGPSHALGHWHCPIILSCDSGAVAPTKAFCARGVTAASSGGSSPIR